MFPKSDIIENRSQASVYKPPKLLLPTPLGWTTNTQSQRVFWRIEDGFDCDLAGGGLAAAGLSTFLFFDFFTTTSVTGSAESLTGVADSDASLAGFCSPDSLPATGWGVSPTGLSLLGFVRTGVFLVTAFFAAAFFAAAAAAEIGAERGERVRNRAFFIFDRSIPVAYEPGKNHNVDKAIRVKTIID